MRYFRPVREALQATPVTGASLPLDSHLRGLLDKEAEVFGAGPEVGTSQSRQQPRHSCADVLEVAWDMTVY